MPALRNHKYELFAQELFKGLPRNRTIADCFIRTGCWKARGHSADQSASNILKRHPEIRGRVEELQERAANRAAVSRASLLQKLDAAFDIAERDRDPNSMVYAVNQQAKISGLIVKKVEIGEAGSFADVDSPLGVAQRMFDSLPGIERLTAQDADQITALMARQHTELEELVRALLAKAVTLRVIETRPTVRKFVGTSPRVKEKQAIITRR